MGTLINADENTMPMEIVTVPCLTDNYAFLAHNSANGQTALIDAPQADPILRVLDQRGWTLNQILITHHHDDHIAGIARIVAKTGARVLGAAADAHRLPPLDHAFAAGDSIRIGDEAGEVIDVSGHTIGHVAFHFPQSAAVFTADSLMALGCGRLFEGTPAQMWSSLSKLAALPPETVVYSGHEYTAANARFAKTIEPDNPDLTARIQRIEAARAAGIPTVPSTLAEELATNPFLRAGLSDVKSAINMVSATDVEVFTEIRRRKDAF